MPKDVLEDVVLNNGECVWRFTDGDPPDLAGLLESAGISAREELS